jgi:hypothetical protein
MGWFTDLFKSKTESVDTSQPMPMPQYTVDSVAPWGEKLGRQMAGAWFGVPGQSSGMMNQPIPIPIRQAGGLSPLEIQARNLAGGLGGFGGQLSEAQGLMRRSTGEYNPWMTQQYYNPYEEDVVQQTIRDAQEAQQRSGIQRRQQALSSGAFGGSRGRMLAEEAQRGFGRGLGESLGDIRQRGYGAAQQAGMGEFGRARGAERAAGQGIAGLGQQGYDMLRSQIGMLGGLGATGRGIQDMNNLYRYQAAQQMAEEPWMRMQRGMAMLGGLSPFMATTRRGMQSMPVGRGFRQQPSGFSQGIGTLGQLYSLFGRGQGQGQSQGSGGGT